MIKIGVKDARKKFSEFINSMRDGEEITITKRDEPVAKLVPIVKGG